MPIIKPCPYCAQTITASAKKCCHCHEWLRFHPRGISRLVMFGMVAAILFLLIYHQISGQLLLSTPNSWHSYPKNDSHRYLPRGHPTIPELNPNDTTIPTKDLEHHHQKL